MTTKAQERQALEKIRKIVDELGENSYVGMAFNGCFELAEENIDNDWGCSLLQRANIAEAQLGEALDKAEKFEKKAQTLQGALDDALSSCERMNHVFNDAMSSWKKDLETVEQEKADVEDKLTEANVLLKKKDLEIVHLKAKLYDLMMQEQG